MDLPSEKNFFQAGHAKLLLDSYRSLLGKELISRHDDRFKDARLLFHAPIAVISHDTREDPIFNYANLQAMTLFARSWSEFTSLPSRYSAESIEQNEREILLAEVRAKGYVYPLQGMRTAKTGQRFMINDGAVWNLIDGDGHYRGQAACILRWTLL